jgi:signal transduction histidine kinase
LRPVIGLFILSAMLPLVLLGAVLGALSFNSEKAVIDRQARDWARFSATLVAREIAANQRSVQMVTQSPAFDAEFDAARLEILGRRLLADEPSWRILSVSDPAGVRIVDVPEPIGGKPKGPVVDKESLRRAVESRAPVVGSIMEGPQRRQAFAVRAPVIRDGRVRYVVSAVVDPAHFAPLLQPGGAADGWSIQAIDSGGRIVADSTNPAAVGKRASEAAIEATKSTGKGLREWSIGLDRQAVGLATPVGKTGWFVYVEAPRDAYIASTRRAGAVLLFGGLIGTGLALLMVRLARNELSRQHQKELAILENQRLEALGLMTGGIAHDFNNLLTPIIGGLDLLHRKLENDARSLRIVDGAMESAERCRALVSRLLAFARRQSLTPRDTDLVGLLEGLTDLLERSVGPNVTVVLKLEEPPLCAKVDPAQLELAVLNLAVNARDAMPEGGELTIGAAEVVTRQQGPLRAGRYVRISVSDTGVGMDAGTLKRAIEPFYTTKDVGRGTGLGLSMVHGMAAQSGGALVMSSEPGKGTTAEIWLPAGLAPPVVERAAEPVVDALVGRLLLVDDDDLVRSATADMLTDHGHRVVEARSVAEALRILRDTPAIDAVVTDYAMPGRTGADLATAARELRPGLPVLLITGFAATGVLPSDIPCLAKPFRRIELLEEVSRLLTPTV